MVDLCFADRLAIASADVDLQMLGTNADPDTIARLDDRTRRDLEAVFDLDPCDITFSTQDLPDSEIRHSDRSSDRE
jgi:hypothetical protein